MGANNVLSSIAARAAQRYAEQEGDYRDADGLLMCGKCHTHKQVRQPFLGSVKVLAQASPMLRCANGRLLMMMAETPTS